MHWVPLLPVGLAPAYLSINHSTNNNQRTFNIKSIYFPHLPDHRLPKRRQQLPSRTLPWERGLVKTGEVFSPMPGSLRQREVMAGWWSMSQGHRGQGVRLMSRLEEPPWIHCLWEEREKCKCLIDWFNFCLLGCLVATLTVWKQGYCGTCSYFLGPHILTSCNNTA